LSIPPEHFQKRIHVRLPYTDAYLQGKMVGPLKNQLLRAFDRPLLSMQITTDSMVKNSGNKDAYR
jgi:hypothetical protein